MNLILAQIKRAAREIIINLTLVLITRAARRKRLRVRIVIEYTAILKSSENSSAEFYMRMILSEDTA